MDAIVELKNVSYWNSQGRQVLRDVSLSVLPGERVRFLGTQGSGREDLMKVMAGMERPDSGAVFVGEHSLCELEEEQVAVLRGTCFGYASWEPGFWPEYTVLDNVAMPQMLRGTSREEREETAVKHLKALGLSHVIFAFPKSLSAMELRLAGVARALASGGEILVLDNIFAGLSEREAHRLADGLEAQLSQGRYTVLSFTDNGNEMLRTDKVFLVESGEIRR